MKKYIRNDESNSEGGGGGHSSRYQGNKRKLRNQYRPWSPPPWLDTYGKSLWLFNSFDGGVVKARSNESTENMIRRFKKSVEQAGIVREMKKREFYMTKSQTRRDKKKRALKRRRKDLKKELELNGESIDPKFLLRPELYRMERP